MQVQHSWIDETKDGALVVDVYGAMFTEHSAKHFVIQLKIFQVHAAGTWTMTTAITLLFFVLKLWKLWAQILGQWDEEFALESFVGKMQATEQLVVKSGETT